LGRSQSLDCARRDVRRCRRPCRRTGPGRLSLARGRLLGPGPLGDRGNRRRRARARDGRRHWLGRFRWPRRRSGDRAHLQRIRHASELTDHGREADQDQPSGQRRRACDEERGAEGELIDWNAKSDRGEAYRRDHDTQHRQDHGHTHVPHRPATIRTPVVRFRSSSALAARSDTNFGIQGPLATL
jgi:hypothetical protein